MLKETEARIVFLYKKGYSYKQIKADTGVKIETAAAMIRRKYPGIQKGSVFKRKQLVGYYVKRIVADLGVTEARAQCIFAAMSDRFDNKKRSTRANKIPFKIEFTQLRFPKLCPYLGIELDYLSEDCKAANYPTFDRVDNSKGYEVGNVLIVSWRGNRLKSDSTHEELMLLATNLKKCTSTDVHVP